MTTSQKPKTKEDREIGRKSKSTAKSKEIGSNEAPPRRLDAVEGTGKAKEIRSSCLDSKSYPVTRTTDHESLSGKSLKTVISLHSVLLSSFATGLLFLYPVKLVGPGRCSSWLLHGVIGETVKQAEVAKKGFAAA